MTPLHQNKNILTHGGCFFTDQDKITCRTIAEGIKQGYFGGFVDWTDDREPVGWGSKNVDTYDIPKNKNPV